MKRSLETDDAEFEHLDGGVQEAFQSYLAERGVDDSLGKFISSLFTIVVADESSAIHPIIRGVQRTAGQSPFPLSYSKIICPGFGLP